MATQELDEQILEGADHLGSLKAHRRQIQEKNKRILQKDPSWIRDIAGGITMILALAFLLILGSYDPGDPSPFNESSQHRANNLLGIIGAYVAAYFVEGLGFSSIILPFVLGYLGYLVMRTKKVQDKFLQFGGGSVIVLSFLVFMGSFSAVGYKGFHVKPGGFVGQELWILLSRYFNSFGSYFLLFTLSAIALLVATQLTFQAVLAKVLSWIRVVAGLIYGIYGRVRARLDVFMHRRTHHKIIERELRKMNGDHEQGNEKKKSFRRKAKPVEVQEPSAREDDIPTRDLDDEDYDLPPEPGFWEENMEVGPDDDTALSEPIMDDKLQPETELNDLGIKVNQPKHQRPRVDMQVSRTDAVHNWVFPNSSFFTEPREEHKVDETELRAKAKALDEKFGEFSVTGQMMAIHSGPVVTTYEYKPDAGIKYSKIVNLQDDLCLALGAESIRIDRMPGRSAVGLEVPNDKRELITFRELIEDKEFATHKSKLFMTLGKTIEGTPFFADLAKMPHLLIAGQTGSGKSVGLNAMICSMLMRATPQDVKLILIDPKMVEFSIYSDIPHLLTPVVIDPQEAANALKWAVVEMENRYKLLAGFNFRNIDHFNKSVRHGDVTEDMDGNPLEPLPFIVVVIDELADLMMVARGEVEESIARIAQKSRAVGIHLMLATQRPSVDIITGVIKSNLPSRLSYRVSQRNDSRIILDANGAEKLLGKGDGLFLGPGTSRLVRIHAPFLSEREVEDLVNFIKAQGRPSYDHSVLKTGDESYDDDSLAGKLAARNGEDDMYEKAARLVVHSGQASVSYLQRKLSLGYARAAKLVDIMEADGIVGPSQGSKARDILVPADYFDGVDGQLR